MASHKLFENESHRPTPQTYQTKDLSAAVIARCGLSILGKLDIDERKLILKPPKHCSPSEEALTQLVSTYAPILDKALFFNSVQKVIRGYIFFRNLDILPDQGRGINGRWKSSEKTIYINMDASTDRGTFPQQVICILAHEMLHAFLDVYSCVCSTDCRTAMKGGLGIGGHGELFCDPMAAIRAALERDLSWEVDVGLRVSVADEVARGWKPSDDQLSTWGLRRFWDGKEVKQAQIIEKTGRRDRGTDRSDIMDSCDPM